MANINIDTLKFFSNFELTIVDAYTTCLLLANSGLQVSTTSAPGAAPLELSLTYAQVPDNPGRMTLGSPLYVPAGNRASCVLRDSAGTELSWGSGNIAMQEGQPYSISCMPSPAVANNGNFTNIFLQTVITSQLYPAGYSRSLFNILFHGLPFPPPPPSPSTPPAPPQSPTHPQPPLPPAPPPPDCGAYLNPTCASEWKSLVTNVSITSLQG